jgi:hypothetical protein
MQRWGLDAIAVVALTIWAGSWQEEIGNTAIAIACAVVASLSAIGLILIRFGTHAIIKRRFVTHLRAYARTAFTKIRSECTNVADHEAILKRRS